MILYVSVNRNRAGPLIDRVEIFSLPSNPSPPFGQSRILCIPFSLYLCVCSLCILMVFYAFVCRRDSQNDGGSGGGGGKGHTQRPTRKPRPRQTAAKEKTTRFRARTKQIDVANAAAGTEYPRSSSLFRNPSQRANGPPAPPTHTHAYASNT